MALDWEELWRDGITPWDLGDESPPLRQFLADPKCADMLSGISSVLVPGCGRGYDLTLLSHHFPRVIGLDLSETAVLAARSHQAHNPHGDRVQVLQQDFFTYHTVHDALFDYTFFCALEPSIRSRWADHVGRLVRPGGLLIAIVFPVLPGAEPRSHPPYPVTLEEYTSRLVQFALEHVNPAPASHPTRLGKELLAVFRRRSI